ncbi:signal peptidase I [Alteromonas aestuariivivens]|uniref:Signal peptidase I n=1 Tax=Alteromonas aestuariivivens TaxID=1938339 RepID=A0A3D8M682_9ALTE|nr:signal peptidase I [Alteromonas aestuariivivens]RDV24672.1 signal peptidase I [Alteromonas aestuariivivens]
MTTWLANMWQQNKSIFIFLLLMFVVRSSFADWYNVPTGSMNPTIVEGDRIFVNKAAYRIELPFTDIALIETGQPHRGDIVVFNSQAANNRLVKRVIGLPGDRVAMDNNHLRVNGEPLQYRLGSGLQSLEYLPDHPHPIQITGNVTHLSSFGEVTVPQGHLLVLGDNRNNSADSRVYGFVPMSEVQGQALSVILSLDPENFYLPRPSRTFSPMI